MIRESILVNGYYSVGVGESNFVRQCFTVSYVQIVLAEHISILSQQGLISTTKKLRGRPEKRNPDNNVFVQEGYFYQF